MRNGDVSSAASYFERVLKLDPGFASSLYGRGLLEQRKGKQAEAERDFAAAKHSMPNIVQLLADQHIWPQ
jgi:tetratricopeptide (TPR) repeat protein